MTKRTELGGIIHTYQRYDPARFPSPTRPPPDLVGPAFEHMLAFGPLRRLTDAELARARIRLRQTWSDLYAAAGAYSRLPSELPAAEGA